ncbi:Proteophosphoglycan ppg1 [Rhodotorula diobovata]|uniref:Mediator of RNA polymerase II transcription subunit 17 n=1 Tax=Rhodotorula diobovata TaxID=5288 RepID=A0A5C5G2N3_9BASI|nr:Proteophosphoglycan ppg1 [Rhodotorula diobovata]
MSSTTQLSLEPLQPFAGDGHDQDLFARPARLHEVRLDDGREVFTRDDPKKSLSERLMRVWAERGDYSELSEERILHPPKDQEHTREDEDARPAVEDIRALQETMIHNLALARGELTTALDLLSVLSAPRDPPDVDVASLPLPQQTLSALPTVPPPPPPALDPQQNPLAPLPLASSLDALSRSARAFFGASEALVPLSDEELAVLAASSSSASAAPRAPPRQRARPRAPDPWPTILRLHHASPRPLVPLGAAPGASLAAGKGESRTARSVGVFFGAQEARAGARAGAVARVGELLEEGAAERSGRRLVVEVEGAAAVGERERVVWGQEDEVGLDGGEDAAEEMDKVERVLRARGNAVFAEELFAQLTTESRTDGALRAELQLGSRTEGDTVSLSGSGWTLRISMATTPERSTAAHPTASLVSSLLRLLFLQSYAARRDSPAATPRPLLATVAAFLGHAQRERALKGLLERLRARAAEAEGVEAVAEVDGEAEGRDGDGAGRRHAADVLQVLDGAAVLGGRATLRVGNSTVFTVLHSFPLPPVSRPSPGGSTATPALLHLPQQQQPTLTLRVPGRAAPLSLPSLRHLETFLGEQVERACRVDKAQRDAGDEA